ncbi:MAG: ROK family protein [Candidatus Limnocylindrales bacterium]
MLALDLGASLVRAAIVDPDGRLLSRSEGPTPLVDGPDALVRACVDHLIGARDAAGAGARPHAIGVAAPGPLDPWTGTLTEPPNLGPAFHGLPLGADLAAALDLPVAVDRDTQVALLAEATFGAAEGLRDAVYLTVSTGIGGAVLSDGRLLVGPDGTAGELGHMTIDLDGPLCGCGARGHLEAIASGAAIANLARESGAFPPGVTARDVARAEGSGDPTAVAIMTRARRAFAAACVSIVDIFDPEVIVVGGAIARNQGERWLGPAREAVRRDAFHAPARRVRIVPAALGADVGLVGAQPLVAARQRDGTLIHPSTQSSSRTPIGAAATAH